MSQIRAEYWDSIYQSKSDSEVSWTEDYPNVGIDYLKRLNIPKDAPIIDVGGGASRFVDAALALGYQDITILDVSKTALERSKARLGSDALKVKWIVSDITVFEPEASFHFWYDRAVFHFLIDKDDIIKYINLLEKSTSKGAQILIGTFSENGPLKCSGLPVTRYSEESMKGVFANSFTPQECFKHKHLTPFKTFQEFQFCGFKKR